MWVSCVGTGAETFGPPSTDFLGTSTGSYTRNGAAKTKTGANVGFQCQGSFKPNAEMLSPSLPWPPPPHLLKLIYLLERDSYRERKENELFFSFKY